MNGVAQPYRLKECESVLVVILNGYFSPELSDLSLLPANIIICSMADADGVSISIPDACELTIPVHLLSIANNETASASQSGHLIRLGKNSQLCIVDEYIALSASAYTRNTATAIHMDKESQLHYYKIQDEDTKADHVATTRVFQDQDSDAAFTSFSLGGQSARDEVVVKLQASGAACDAAGFYHLKRDNQHVDHHISIYHAASHTQSDMLYKGILENKSRAVFNGHLQVEANTKKIVAHQANHHLLLSPYAEAYAKPELEIYADDVKCKHGATTGQLDQDALFYLRSRGIDKAEAVNMLLHSFSDAILQRITHPAIKTHIENKMCVDTRVRS